MLLRLLFRWLYIGISRAEERAREEKAASRPLAVNWHALVEALPAK